METAEAAAHALVSAPDRTTVVRSRPGSTTGTQPWTLEAFDSDRLGHFTGPLGVLKRVFDVALAVVLLAVFLPLFLVVVIAIKLDDRGPILYRQARVGHRGKVFSLLKFRSMVAGAEHLVLDLTDQNVTNGLLFKLEADPRVTRVGGILRRLSLDELPQLWNVVVGDMSLVGPRPLAVKPEEFDGRANLRHYIRPGITGFWQVSGGNGLTYHEMIDLDLMYIRSHSFGLDIRLLARTLPALLDRRRPC